MVCLKHVEHLCTSCAFSSFTLNYHYTIKELEGLEAALASRLKQFYAWRDRLSSLLKSTETVDLKSRMELGSSSPSSSVVIKKEPMDNEPDQPPTSEACVTTITLQDLLVSLYVFIGVAPIPFSIVIVEAIQPLLLLGTAGNNVVNLAKENFEV